MFAFSTVVVSGNSMSPAYQEGDWLIIRNLSGKKHTLKIGAVYLIQDPNRPGVKLLKRLKESRIEHGVIRYWVEGDMRIGNGTDSVLLHNPKYDFNDQNLSYGAAYWTRLVERFLEEA